MEMKVKELRKYQSMYCSLCDRLKKDYGFLSRFILSYDITFLLISLNFLVSDTKENINFRCPYNPVRKIKNEVNIPILEYSAFINYWLVIEKLSDDIQDNNSYIKKAFKKLLESKKYKHNLKKYNPSIIILHQKLKKIYELESDATGMDDFDRLTNEFGTFFAKIFDTRNILDVKTKYNEIYEKIFFQIGKWIYIMDAFDDYLEDNKKHRFNILFLLKDQNSKATYTKQDVYTNVYYIHIQIIAKLSELLNELSETIDESMGNIISYGMTSVFLSITDKKFKECKDGVNGTNNLMGFVETTNTEKRSSKLEN